MRILITGGLGYIGSHTCVEFLQKNHEIIVIDNYKNSYPHIVERIKKITGKDFIFIKGDLRDISFLKTIFKKFPCDMVVHFAGLKSVREANQNPLLYYDYNVRGSLYLIKAMQEAQVKKLIFSSSATVYGAPAYLPYDEEHPLKPNNVYGQTKLIVENMLRDLVHSDPEWEIIILRYFNPAGAHKTGLLGESPRGYPNNLMPFIAEVAMGLRKKLIIHGDDYITKDGTAIRDYIHVVDLAQGHIEAANHLKTGVQVFNLGRGKGETVLDVVHMFETVSGLKIPFTIGPRRSGDLAEFYADADKARYHFNWQARYDLLHICEDMWRFQKNNILAHNKKNRASLC